MESFSQIIDYIKSDFGIPDVNPYKEDENKDHKIVVSMEFIKNFHKEFNTYQEEIVENLKFLDEEKFEHITPVSKWFKENREHENFVKCRNNLYALLCISQDLMGNEMLKGLKSLGDINSENIHEHLQALFGDDANSPFAELLKDSPILDLLKNENLKDMIANISEKLKNVDLDGLIKSINEGNFDMQQITSLISQFSGGNPGISNAMNLLGNMMTPDAEQSALSHLTPEQRAAYRREKAKAEYRRKIRAREKAKEKAKEKERKRKKRAKGNRKKKGGRNGKKGSV